MIEEQKIKGLKSQVNKMKGEAQSMQSIIGTKQREYSAKLKAIEEIEAKIRNAKTSKPTVSEHAIIRYFERVKGYDMAVIEKEILSDEVLSLVNQLGGNGGYPNQNFKVLMRNFTVTTITT